jgi:hypothetical protein
MNSALVVMKYPMVENVLEMSLSQRDEEIQALSADGSHQTFASGMSFGRSSRRPTDAHAHSRYGLIQFPWEDAVPVMDEKTERMIIRERFPQLLQGPLRAGVIGDVVVQDSAPTQFHENEYIKDTEAGRNYDEKVAGYHRLGMISHEGRPALLGIGTPAWAPRQTGLDP